jgi:aminopeptidase
MAQQAEMSTEGFEDFYFKTCTLDYDRMSKAMDPLVSLMQRTDRVRLVGPGTDLRFSIKGIPIIKCDGALNIPDGEVYTAPVKDSVNGTIQYNAKTLYQGKVFENILLKFKDGKIVEASSSNTKALNAILDTDEGARYIGEFAIGVNPYVTKAMLDTLFDEKITGSIHFTPGNSYNDAYNGNRSTVHWDMVLIQTPEWGGGEIYFDDALIRKDGRFVLRELEGLNPERLS